MQYIDNDLFYLAGSMINSAVFTSEARLCFEKHRPGCPFTYEDYNQRPHLRDEIDKYYIDLPEDHDEYYDTVELEVERLSLPDTISYIITIIDDSKQIILIHPDITPSHTATLFHRSSSKNKEQLVRPFKQLVRPSNNSKQLVRPINNTEQLVRPINNSKQLVRPINNSKQLIRSINNSKQLVRSIDNSKQLVRPINNSKQLVRPIDNSKQLIRSINKLFKLPDSSNNPKKLINNSLLKPTSKLKYKINDYIKPILISNHIIPISPFANDRDTTSF
jgi:hypothetical protein